MLPPGSVSSLAFANRFVGLALMLAAAATSAVLGPYFAELAASGRWKDARESVRRYARTAWLISIPIAVALMLGTRPLVRLFLQHGRFGVADTDAVAPVIVSAAIQIPFFAVSRVHYRFIIAMRRSDLILYCGVVNLVLDVILNIVLMRWFGVSGIALSTSLWTVATWGFLALCSRRLLRNAEAEQFDPRGSDGR